MQFVKYNLLGDDGCTVIIKDMHKEKPTGEPYQFRVDRESPVGNPYIMHREAEREWVCKEYENYFKCQVAQNTAFKGYIDKIVEALNRYKRVELYCWCFPKQCHAETIKRYLEQQINNN